MIKRQIIDYLHDILDAMNAAESFIEGITFEDFQNDQKTIFAVTRAIEIIGEAAKSIPKTIREQYPSFVTLRDFLLIKKFQKQRYQFFEPFVVTFSSFERPL